MGNIEKRKSIRKFQNKKIEKRVIQDILQAGLLAPSPKNRQPWQFVVISNENKKNELVDAMRQEIAVRLKENSNRSDIYASLESMNIIEQAPVLILVCYRYGMVEQHDDGVDWQISSKDLEAVELQSIGAAVENMLLKATELEIGSLWCADILYAYKTVSSYSTNPVVSAVCLGHKNEMPEMKKRNALSDMCIFY